MKTVVKLRPTSPTTGDDVVVDIVAASFLLILAASTFRELARADAPHHIPFGFHGNYLAEASRSAPAQHLR